MFFEEVLVNLFESFLLRKNSTSVRLQMIVVIIAGKGDLSLRLAIEERKVCTLSSSTRRGYHRMPELWP